MSYTYYYHSTSRTAPLAYPHYSDPRFDGQGADLFGQQTEGIQYEYDDRLAQWEPEKHRAAVDAARASGAAPRSVAFLEAYLSHYYARPVEVVHVKAGTRPFDGYAWYAYGFRFTA